VKKAATKEQKDEMFKYDKYRKSVKKKKHKKRKALENRLRKQKEAQDQCASDTGSINGTGRLIHYQICTIMTSSCCIPLIDYMYC
jgi:hypothetical protein